MVQPAGRLYWHLAKEGLRQNPGEWLDMEQPKPLQVHVTRMNMCGAVCIAPTTPFE